MITLTLSLVGMLATFGAVKVSNSLLAFMAGMSTVLVIAVGI